MTPPQRGSAGRPDWLAHIVLALGVMLFALPVWLVLAGSTQDSGAITRGELSLLPHLVGLAVYARVLTQGTMGTEPVWHMLLVSARHGAGDRRSARSSSRCCRPTPWCSSASRSAAPRSG